jgi:hypothetical protein
VPKSWIDSIAWRWRSGKTAAAGCSEFAEYLAAGSRCDPTLTLEPTNHLATRSRLNEYLDGVGSLLTDKRQRASSALYATGLLNEGERKSMEPLAARASGERESCSAVNIG